MIGDKLVDDSLTLMISSGYFFGLRKYGLSVGKNKTERGFPVRFVVLVVFNFFLKDIRNRERHQSHLKQHPG